MVCTLVPTRSLDQARRRNRGTLLQNLTPCHAMPPSRPPKSHPPLHGRPDHEPVYRAHQRDRTRRGNSAAAQRHNHERGGGRTTPQNLEFLDSQALPLCLAGGWITLTWTVLRNAGRRRRWARRWCRAPVGEWLARARGRREQRAGEFTNWGGVREATREGRRCWAGTAERVVCFVVSLDSLLPFCGFGFYFY